MPHTTALFLIGSVSIAGLPPTSGFVSEMMLFQAYFYSSELPDPLLKVLLIITLSVFALTSALAAALFVKLFGITFLALPRTKCAQEANEVPKPMPPFPIFSAKFFILLEAFGFSKPLVFAVLLLLVIASAAFARFLIEAFTQSSKDAGTEGPEALLLPYVVRNGMKFPIISILFIILALGVVFPEPLENLLNIIVYELGYL